MALSFSKHYPIVVFMLTVSACAHTPHHSASNRTLSAIPDADSLPKLEAQDYPILFALKKSGHVLSDNANQWMENWLGIDLERIDTYTFPALSGSTSVNLKISMTDTDTNTELKKLGTFVATNDSGNPTAEIAYFNMAAILGWDQLIRPVARYELGPVASHEFSEMITSGMADGKITSGQNKNALNILRLIQTGNPLQGCLKAEKDKSDIALDEMCDGTFGNNGGPKMDFPVVKYLQVVNPAPAPGTPLKLVEGYIGDARTLAREYSVIMTLDVIFEQGDRYSGGNLGIWKTADGVAHFHSTDNGGAYLQETTDPVSMNLSWFSRYDRKTVKKLREINQFLRGKQKVFLGYRDPDKFVVDLGFYFEMSSEDSTRILQRNIQLFLNKVDAVVAAHGKDAYLD